MKLLTKEEEEEHTRVTYQGGLFGGVMGTLVGTGAVIIAQRRSPNFRALTVPFRTFLACSAGTFSAIIAADRASRNFEAERMPERNLQQDKQAQLRAELESQKPFLQRAQDFANENRYSIVFATWLASIGLSWLVVRRNVTQTPAQKIVQVRMYAQGATVGVLLASLALEGNDARKKVGRWETVKVLDPKDPEHKRMIEKRVHHERYPGEDQWMDMVAAEERKMKAREEKLKSAVKSS